MKHIRILGKPFTIERVDPNPLGEQLGASSAVEQRIIIATGTPPEQEADTLLHEIIHAIDYTIQIDLTERQVHALTGALFAVFRDNPGLAERLLLTSGAVLDEPVSPANP